MDVVLVVVGIGAVVLGGAGVLGFMDRTRFSLYQRHGVGDVPPEKHRQLQRLGGAFMVVAGVVFVVMGLTR
ncbi:hypothetical protein DQ237_00580 [Blastococcus sp. TF02-8]|uniref:hypothetical protein n=1 Tax=Blastococcus sp. TF02-8 TaxID=2250574 RepID=UPI000DEA79E3|nr:hypothetical protein [Blastococcus sp. TF02-8]RBY97488.1 hypothetical protein DQ237_00580 [Blastococcus sp. TF02-8]